MQSQKMTSNSYCMKNSFVGLMQKRLMTLGVHLPTEINLSAVVNMFKERAHTINEMVDMGLFLLQPLQGYDEKAEAKAFKQSAIGPLQAVITKCQAITDWATADLHQLIADVVAELEVGFGQVGMPVRLALSGQAQGPANDEIMQVLGQEESIRRLQAALQHLTEKFS